MRIPAFLHGKYADVKKACRKRARAIWRGASLDSIEEGPWLDSQTTEGLLVLNGPFPLVGGKAHFHLFALETALSDLCPSFAARREMEAQWLSWSVQEPWRLLGIMNQGSRVALGRNPLVWSPFLRAAVQFWSVFDAEAPRYSYGSDHGEKLWQLPTCLQYVLARRGVSTPTLNAPLPAGGLAELVMPLLAANEN